MSSVPPLLSAPGAGKPSRSASCAVAKPTRGFHVFRIDGYSWTMTLPCAERITSELFTVGGQRWCVDYYPNGTGDRAKDVESDSNDVDGAKDDDSDSVSVFLYLRMAPGTRIQRVRAEYKFSLLDHLTGNAAYERPAETGVFTGTVVESLGCGYAGFIAKEELERRRDSLLGRDDDCLAIRCDVGVTEVDDDGSRTIFEINTLEQLQLEHEMGMR